jgi:hypothetical protein
MPIATAGQAPIFADAAAARARMSTADFDPRRTVFLATELRQRITATNHVVATVLEIRRENGRSEIITESPEPTLLVFAQSFHHNWRAYVDDKPSEIFKANHAFQAVQVPAGRSRVRLVYEDSAFRTGSVASGLSLALWGGLWWRQRRNATALRVSQ